MSRYQQALLTCAAEVVLGLVALVLGYRVVARTELVSDQVPALVSGGLGGLGLVLVGCVSAFVQVGRRCGERERELQAQIVQEVAATTALRRRRLAAAELAEAGPAVQVPVPALPRPRTTVAPRATPAPRPRPVAR